jgi:hypothetical protein
MMFKEIIAVDFEDHMKRVSKLRELLVSVQIIYITIIRIQWTNIKKM